MRKLAGSPPFDIQEVFEDAPLPLIQPEGPIIKEVEEGEEAIHLSQNEDPSQAALQQYGATYCLHSKHHPHPEAAT